MKRKCRECGLNNDVKLEYCEKCGTKFEKKVKGVRRKDAAVVGDDFDAQEILNYKNDVELADLLYKAYVTLGISRLDKVDGRFLASQTIKLDTIIEQNTKIIELLEKIVEK
ncbi:MAG: hypothetical protein ACLQG5_10475 [Methanobacterium sp.]|jgi:uncharacterized membrane protein YvbJ